MYSSLANQIAHILFANHKISYNDYSINTFFCRNSFNNSYGNIVEYTPPRAKAQQTYFLVEIFSFFSIKFNYKFYIYASVYAKRLALASYSTEPI